LISRLALHLTQ